MWRLFFASVNHREHDTAQRMPYIRSEESSADVIQCFIPWINDFTIALSDFWQFRKLRLRTNWCFYLRNGKYSDQNIWKVTSIMWLFVKDKILCEVSSYFVCSEELRWKICVQVTFGSVMRKASHERCLNGKINMVVSSEFIMGSRPFWLWLMPTWFKRFVHIFHASF